MSTLTSTAPTTEFAARVGIDWADQKHVWAMRTADGKLQRGELDHTPEAVQAWAAKLEQDFGGRPVAVALEQARGALIAMLCKYAHLVLFPIHPNTVQNYRQAFYPSGAKSDPCDGDLILELLVSHPERLRRMEPDTEATRSLQFLTEERRGLVNRQTSETQRLLNWLKQIYPQILEWFPEPACAMVGEWLLRWPTLQAVQKVKAHVLRNFLRKHNCRSAERIEERIQQIGQAVPATNDAALLRVGVLCIQHSVRILQQFRQGIAEFDELIASTYRDHPDRPLMESFPGAGSALEPRLIAAVGTLRERFPSAQSLASYAGIAPVKAASGKSARTHWRFACPKFIRQTFHEWAGCSIRFCDWAKQHYESQRAKGKKHHAAVRSVAFKWIRIFYRCWRDRVPYSDQLYQKARQARAATAPSAGVNFEWKSCGGFSKLTAISS